MKEKIKQPSEKSIETAILTYLNFLPKCFAWKNNSVGVYDSSRSVYRKAKSKFNISGVSDILGIYHGRFLAIEVKRGSGGRVSREQHDYIERIKTLGGIAGVCTSVDEARELIKTSGGSYVESNIEGVSE
jgi:penicillin-binding protein-related factor A (putative recombinase)